MMNGKSLPCLGMVLLVICAESQTFKLLSSSNAGTLSFSEGFASVALTVDASSTTPSSISISVGYSRDSSEVLTYDGACSVPTPQDIEWFSVLSDLLGSNLAGVLGSASPVGCTYNSTNDVIRWSNIRQSPCCLVSPATGSRVTIDGINVTAPFIAWFDNQISTGLGNIFLGSTVDPSPYSATRHEHVFSTLGSGPSPNGVYNRTKFNTFDANGTPSPAPSITCIEWDTGDLRTFPSSYVEVSTPAGAYIALSPRAISSAMSPYKGSRVAFQATWSRGKSPRTTSASVLHTLILQEKPLIVGFTSAQPFTAHYSLPHGVNVRSFGSCFSDYGVESAYQPVLTLQNQNAISTLQSVPISSSDWSTSSQNFSVTVSPNPDWQQICMSASSGFFSPPDCSFSPLTYPSMASASCPISQDSGPSPCVFTQHASTQSPTTHQVTAYRLKTLIDSSIPFRSLPVFGSWRKSHPLVPVNWTACASPFPIGVANRTFASVRSGGFLAVEGSISTIRRGYVTFSDGTTVSFKMASQYVWAAAKNEGLSPALYTLAGLTFFSVIYFLWKIWWMCAPFIYLASATYTAARWCCPAVIELLTYSYWAAAFVTTWLSCPAFLLWQHSRGKWPEWWYLVGTLTTGCLTALCTILIAMNSRRDRCIKTNHAKVSWPFVSLPGSIWHQYYHPKRGYLLGISPLGLPLRAYYSYVARARPSEVSAITAGKGDSVIHGSHHHAFHNHHQPAQSTDLNLGNVHPQATQAALEFALALPPTVKLTRHSTGGSKLVHLVMLQACVCLTLFPVSVEARVPLTQSLISSTPADVLCDPLSEFDIDVSSMSSNSSGYLLSATLPSAAGCQYGRLKRGNQIVSTVLVDYSEIRYTVPLLDSYFTPVFNNDTVLMVVVQCAQEEQNMWPSIDASVLNPTLTSQSPIWAGPVPFAGSPFEVTCATSWIPDTLFAGAACDFISTSKLSSVCPNGKATNVASLHKGRTLGQKFSAMAVCVVTCGEAAPEYDYVARVSKQPINPSRNVTIWVKSADNAISTVSSFVQTLPLWSWPYSHDMIVVNQKNESSFYLSSLFAQRGQPANINQYGAVQIAGLGWYAPILARSGGCSGDSCSADFFEDQSPLNTIVGNSNVASCMTTISVSSSVDALTISTSRDSIGDFKVANLGARVLDPMQQVSPQLNYTLSMSFGSVTQISSSVLSALTSSNHPPDSSLLSHLYHATSAPASAFASAFQVPSNDQNEGITTVFGSCDDSTGVASVLGTFHREFNAAENMGSWLWTVITRPFDCLSDWFPRSAEKNQDPLRPPQIQTDNIFEYSSYFWKMTSCSLSAVLFSVTGGQHIHVSSSQHEFWLSRFCSNIMGFFGPAPSPSSLVLAKSAKLASEGKNISSGTFPGLTPLTMPTDSSSLTVVPLISSQVQVLLPLSVSTIAADCSFNALSSVYLPDSDGFKVIVISWRSQTQVGTFSAFVGDGVPTQIACGVESLTIRVHNLMKIQVSGNGGATMVVLPLPSLFVGGKAHFRRMEEVSAKVFSQADDVQTFTVTSSDIPAFSFSNLGDWLGSVLSTGFGLVDGGSLWGPILSVVWCVLIGLAIYGFVYILAVLYSRKRISVGVELRKDV